APFAVPVPYLEQSAELAYAGNVYTSQGMTVDTARLVVSAGMNREMLYVGMTRGREENSAHVVTGPPDPAGMTRAEREAFARRAIERAGELLRRGDRAGALAVPRTAPEDRKSTRLNSSTWPPRTRQSFPTRRSSDLMNREMLYVGMTRGREENSAHVVTGPPDPAGMTRAEREAFARRAIERAGELLRRGDRAGALAVPRTAPEPDGMRDRAPWEAVLAGAMARDDPELTALEQVKAAQDAATDSRHLLTLAEAFWWKFAVPRIDQAIRERIGERAFARYLTDPERPALLQALRAHEIGGRRIEDSLDAITGRTLDGARSIAAVLHGRLDKEPAPARGQTRTWAERAPRDAPDQALEAARMLDARQAELGRQLAAQPPEWALRAWGVPPARAGALREDWERRAAVVESYREAAGITGPAQAIGPLPSGQAQLREAFHASVVALELPGEQALLRAMGRGQLEAQVSTYQRAAALAPRDVSAELTAADRRCKSDIARAQAARAAGRDAEADTAGILAGMTAGELAGLR